MSGAVQSLAQEVAEILATKPVTRRLLTVAQAAEYLNRSEAGIRHLVAERSLPAVRIDKRVYFDIRDLDTLIQNSKGYSTKHET